MLNNTESTANCRLESDIETCILADDTLIDIVAMVYLKKKKLNKSHIKSKFYILRNSHEKVIIGCDFLRRFEGNNNFKDNTLTFTNQEIDHKTDSSTTAQIGYINSEQQNNTYTQPTQTQYETDNIDLSESDLNSTEKQEVHNLLRQYDNNFTNDLKKIGCTHLTELDIQVKPGTQPVRKRPFRTNFLDKVRVGKAISSKYNRRIPIPNIVLTHSLSE